LEIVGGIGTVGIGDELVRHIVVFATLDGKMQLPNIFDNHFFAVRRRKKWGAVDCGSDRNEMTAAKWITNEDDCLRPLDVRFDLDKGVSTEFTIE
jgi:hypothetical protein